MSLVRVFNKGSHTFQCGEHTVKPNSFADVTEEHAKILCDYRQHGQQEVFLGSELPSTSAEEAPPSPDPELVAQNEALTAENAEKDAQIANLEKLLKRAERALKKAGANPLD